MTTDPASKPQPTFLDGLEKLLLRVVVIGVILLVALIGLFAYLARTQPQRFVSPPAGGAATAPVSANTVMLTIDFGDGSQMRYPNLPYSSGMTVLDAMNLTKGLKRPLEFTTSGSGDLTLVTGVGGLAGEGAAAGGRNWQYWVNDQYGRVSAATVKLNGGDRVTWVFRPYESEPKAPTP